MTKEPLRPAPLRSSTPLRRLHGDGLGEADGVAVLDGDSPSDTDAVAEAVSVVEGVVDAVSDFVGVGVGVIVDVVEANVYAHHRPDCHAAVLHWAVAT